MKTLEETVKETKDHLQIWNEFWAVVTSRLDYLQRNIYWNLSDYDVSGVSGDVLYLRKK
jgi:hypothetical protein